MKQKVLAVLATVFTLLAAIDSIVDLSKPAPWAHGPSQTAFVSVALAIGLWAYYIRTRRASIETV